MDTENTQKQNNNNSMIIIVSMVVLLLVLGGAVYAFSKNKTTNTESMESNISGSEELNEKDSEKMMEEDTMMDDNQVPNVSPTDSMMEENSMIDDTNSMMSDEGTVTVNIEAGMYYYKPNQIKVKQGDTVKVVMNSIEGMHDFNVDEFNVKTKVIKDGETVEATFVADKVGTYKYYCSVGNHRAMGMVGTLVVE